MAKTKDELLQIQQEILKLQKELEELDEEEKAIVLEDSILNDLNLSK